MSLIYYSKFANKNDELERRIVEQLEKGEMVTYISPTAASSTQKRNYYVEKLGGISKIKFVGFDSVVKKGSNKQIMDASFRKFVLKNILKQGKFEFIGFEDGICDAVSSLIAKGRESLVDSKEFAKSNNPLLNEVGVVYEEYEKFINNSKYTDYSEVPNMNYDMGLVVFDGFFSMKKSDIAVIKNIMKNNEVIFNIPYKINEFNITDKFVNQLLSLGFELKEDDGISLSELVDSFNKSKLFFSKYNNDDEEIKLFKFLKKDLNSGIKPTVISVGQNSKLDFISDYEDLQLNINEKESKNIKLVDEFINLVEFTYYPNRQNLLNRVNLKYFQLNNYDEDINNELMSIKFNSIDELILNTSNEISANIDLEKYLNIIDELKSEVIKSTTFTDYSNYFLNKLEIVRNYIDSFFEDTNDTEIYNRDIEVLEKITAILNRLCEFDENFSRVSFVEYRDILLDYLGSIRISEKDRYRVDVININNSIGIQFENVYVTGFDIEFPNYKEPNFLIETEFDFLKQIGFDIPTVEEIYEEELLKLLSIISNSKSTVIFIDKENCSVYETLFKSEYISENKISSKTELFYKINDCTDENELTNLLMMYDVKNFDEITERVFEERLRIANDNIIQLTDKAHEVLCTKLDSFIFRVKDLDDWIRSPYSFLYTRLIGLDELVKEPQDNINLELGTDYHIILENYFKKYDYYDEVKLKQEIDSIILPRENRELRHLVYFDILSEYIKLDLIERDGYKPEYFEKPIEISLNDRIFKGRIDRIDECDGKYIIIDYKLNNGFSFDKQGVETFQLPLYISGIKNCVEGKYGLIMKPEISHVLRNAEELGKIKSKRNQLTATEFAMKIESATSNAIDVIHNMYKGVFDDFENVDSRLNDLARS